MRPRLEIRHLQMLAAIAHAGGVTRAAELIGLSQSALTHRIREAERRLDLTLFTRVGKRLRMTPAAERLTHAATRILEDLERAERAAREMSEGVEHVVRIGVGTYTRYHWLPAFLKVLRRSSPSLQIEVVAGAMSAPIAMLLDASIDVAVFPGHHEQAELDVVHLFEDELVAVTPPGHRFARRRHVEAAGFADETYITYSLRPTAGFEGERYLRPANVMPRRLVRVELPDAIVELVRAGMGVSVLSQWAIEPYVRAGSLASTRLTRAGLRIDWFAAVRRADGEGSPAHVLAASLAAWCASPRGGFRAVARAG